MYYYRDTGHAAERALRPGDEELNWLTYSDIWRDLQLTRGALDALVTNGEVPWVSGGKLHTFLLCSKHPDIDAARRMGAQLDWSLGIDHNLLYYAVDDFLAKYRAGEAVARLRGDTEHRASKVYKSTLPILANGRLFADDELEAKDKWGNTIKRRR
jgi:hypothetical protein